MKKMKIRLADYIANFLADHGVTDCFTVVGGGAMHLNDAFGHNERIHCTYNHHEQASAIAAEAYARLNNKIAALCVTTGPGGTNAITGVVGGWLDSIPMFVVSGQVKYTTTARYAEQFTDGLPLRAVGDQEFDITKAISCMCKYSAMLEDMHGILPQQADPVLFGSMFPSTIRAVTLKRTSLKAMTRVRMTVSFRPRLATIQLK